MTAIQDRTTYVYTEAFLDRYLYHWPELVTRAQSPSTSYGLMLKGPTPATPRAGARQKGFSGDGLDWACVKADIERAWATLSGMELNCVWARSRGATMEAYALEIGRRSQTIHQVYHEALKHMIEVLNGSDCATEVLSV